MKSNKVRMPWVGATEDTDDNYSSSEDEDVDTDCDNNEDCPETSMECSDEFDQENVWEAEICDSDAEICDIESHPTDCTELHSSEATEVTDTESTVISAWNGFKLVGDNIDKNLRPSFQRLNKQTVSLHYFHTYAVADRIDFSTLSDVVPESITVNPSTFLPDYNDLEALHEEFQILTSRYIVQFKL